MENKLIGNHHIYHSFNKMLQAKRLRGSIIFYGIKGVGKFSWALQFTKLLLSAPISAINNLDSLTINPKVNNLINKNSHPNFLLIQPEFDDKKNTYKDSISVEEIRKIGRFLQSNDDTYYKVIIVDALDNLNINAANAILKNLEEPPANVVFLLIAHNYETLLDTITSRCISLKFKPLDRKEIIQVLEYNNISFPKEGQDILNLAEGSSAKALWYLQADNLNFYKSLQEVILNNNKAGVISFTKEFQNILTDEIGIFFNLLDFLILKHIKQYKFQEIYEFHQNLSSNYYNVKVFNLDKIAAVSNLLFKLQNIKV
ncbi:DNA polymerase III subunit delta [Candidatus Hepatincola sp. Av]